MKRYMGQFFEYDDDGGQPGCGRLGPVPGPPPCWDYLQEAATLAAEDGGFGREIMTLEYHAFWMLARIWYRLDRPLRWEEKVTVRTWHRGSKTALMYRDFDLLAGGVPVGEAVSAWVLAWCGGPEAAPPVPDAGAGGDRGRRAVQAARPSPSCACLERWRSGTAGGWGTATPTSTAM